MRSPLTFEELERRIKERDDYLVVAGCARSATKYISDVFTVLGLDVGHWRMLGEDGISSDLLAPLACLKGARVLHQVRYPINQIGSMQTTLKQTWQFISQVVKFEQGDSLLRMCMKYWLVWNIYAGRAAKFTYRIENIDAVWPEIKKIVGLPEDAVIPNVPRDANTRAGMYEPVTWDMIEAEDVLLYNTILKKAWEYGYRQEDMSERMERLTNEKGI